MQGLPNSSDGTSAHSLRSTPGGEGETAMATGDVEVHQGHTAIHFPETKTYIERRTMLVDQYPVKRRQTGQHPGRNAKARTIDEESDSIESMSDDNYQLGAEVNERDTSTGFKTDFHRYQYDLDVSDWPRVKNGHEATHVLGKASEVALSKTKGVRWTEKSDGSVEYYLCPRPLPTSTVSFSGGQDFVKTLFTSITTWFSKASEVQSTRYAEVLRDPATEELFWSTATEQGKILLGVVASHPELLAASLHNLPVATIESNLPDTKMCGVYLLQGLPKDARSERPGLYVGQTNYLLRRWRQHFLEAHTPIPGVKSPSLVYQILQKIRERGGHVSALPLSQLDADQHMRLACLFEIAWTMAFRSYQGSESYLAHAAGCGLPFLDIVGLNTDHGGGREYTNGNPLNGVNPSLDEIVWDMRSLHQNLLLAQSVILLPHRFSDMEMSKAQQQVVQFRCALERRKSDFAAEKGELLLKGELFISFAYYTTKQAHWMTGTFFGLGIREPALSSIFTKEELRMAKALRFAVVKARLVDVGFPALASDFFLMMTEGQRACVGGVSIVISNPRTGKSTQWQQRSSLSQTAKLTRAFRFISGLAGHSAWRLVEVERVFLSIPPILAGLEGVARRLWQGEQSCKQTGLSFLFNQVESDGATTSGWMLPKEHKLQDAELVGVGIFVRVVMQSSHRVFRGRIHQNEEEELAIACLGLQFFSLQHGWIDIERDYISGGGCIFEQCVVVWRAWFFLQTAITKQHLQEKLPRGVVQEDAVQDLAEEPLLFQTFIGTCYDRNRILVPRNRFDDRKACKISIPVAMAAAWGFCDGRLPKGSQWEMKIDGWGKTQDHTRILVKRITRGKYDHIWLDLDEYRVSTLSAFTISGILWDECQKANEAYPRPLSLISEYSTGQTV